MKALILAAAFLLTACGAPPRGGEGGAEEERVSIEQSLNDLNGKTRAEFLALVIPRLANEPGLENRAAFTRALDQKWKLQCDQICELEKK